MAAIVTLGIFSGRPDPEWPLTPAQEAELQRRIAAAPIVAAGPSSLEEPLGYRGFRVRIGDAGTPLRSFASTAGGSSVPGKCAKTPRERSSGGSSTPAGRPSPPICTPM